MFPGCGAGDGFKLLELLKGWSFKRGGMERRAGSRHRNSYGHKDRKRRSERMAAVKRIWNETGVAEGFD